MSALDSQLLEVERLIGAGEEEWERMSDDELRDEIARHRAALRALCHKLVRMGLPVRLGQGAQPERPASPGGDAGTTADPVSRSPSCSLGPSDETDGSHGRGGEAGHARNDEGGDGRAPSSETAGGAAEGRAASGPEAGRRPSAGEGPGARPTGFDPSAPGSPPLPDPTAVVAAAFPRDRSTSPSGEELPPAPPSSGEPPSPRPCGPDVLAVVPALSEAAALAGADIDSIDPREWQVPPNCIPIHANVTTFDWTKLAAAAQFDVIMMDPPWQLATANPTRGVALGYSQLTDRHIQSLPIPSLQPEGGLLFIWTINAKFALTLSLLRDWGYEIVDEVAWVKLTVNRRMAKSHGFYLQHAKETCLVGRKVAAGADSAGVGASPGGEGAPGGNLSRRGGREDGPSNGPEGPAGVEPDERPESTTGEGAAEGPEGTRAGGAAEGPDGAVAGGLGPPTASSAQLGRIPHPGCRRADPLLAPRDVILSQRRGQSQKPEEIYEVVEELVPGGRYLEIFGRKNNLRDGWVTIGNEVTGAGPPEGDAGYLSRGFRAPGAVYGRNG